MRQATTLLTFAQSTNNRQLAAVLIVKAADLKSKLDESMRPDPSPLAPDAESEISPLTPDVEPEI